MRTPSFDLAGRRALVTGGSRGIGLAAAHALAQAGAHVVIVARDARVIEDACAAIDAGGGEATGCVLDVTDERAVEKLVPKVGPFDVLVNAAGTNKPSSLQQSNSSDVRTLMDLNVNAAFTVTRAATRGMMQRGKGGSVINVSSQMGHVGGPGRTMYCATKHALESFTKALAWELGPQQIRVNTLCPTFIETDMTRPMFEKDAAFLDYCISRIALGRLGQPQDVMGAIVFLASDASALVTGSALMVDGGWTAA